MKTKAQLDCRRYRLGNGLTLLVSENGRLPLVSVHAFVLAGADQNPLSRPGLAALTARLLDEGTEKYSGPALSELIENVGAGLSLFSHHELTVLSLQVKAGDLEMGIELMAEMLRRPLFPADPFRLEKEKVLTELKAMAEDPQSLAGHLLNRAIFQGSPLQYPVLGTEESIRQVELSEVRQFHRRKYSPQDTLFVVVGAAAPDRVRQLASKSFGDWENRHYRRSLVAVPARQTRPLLKEVALDKEQVHVFLGHLGVRRQNPDFYALQVMDVILGAGPGLTSRVPRRLRDEQGLSYQVYCDICGSSGLYPGRFAAYFSTSPNKRRGALEGLLSEIERLQREGVSETELVTAQEYLTGSFVFEFQSNAELARLLLMTELFDLGIDYPQRYPEIIRGVQREDVARVARNYLDTVNYTTVIVGPVEEVERQTRPESDAKTAPPP
ncbi:MAG: M16 family metallopeptidase [Acidobacteriota bacterium]